MRSLLITLGCVTCFFSPAQNIGTGITLYKRDAIVWSEKEIITGKINGFYKRQLTGLCNNNPIRIFVKKDSTFSFSVTLKKGKNKISVSAVNGVSQAPAPLYLSMGFTPAPVMKPYATVKGKQILLNVEIKKNPWTGPMHYSWSADPRNPEPCRVMQKKFTPAGVVRLPALNGTYYFNLMVSNANDTTTFQTYIEKRGSEIHVFNMDTGHSSWIDSAIIYEITPSAFTKNGSFDDITNKLEEIKQLGINTIWLQPVYSSARKGQGYDIIDYFSLREDLGNEAQLKKLIDKAKQLQLKILFDFVPSHTSVHHPYAEDCIKYGTNSHYYDFYQHEADHAAYSSYYKKNKFGFINYFWEDLVI